MLSLLLNMGLTGASLLPGKKKDAVCLTSVFLDHKPESVRVLHLCPFSRVVRHKGISIADRQLAFSGREVISGRPHISSMTDFLLHGKLRSDFDLCM